MNRLCLLLALVLVITACVAIPTRNQPEAYTQSAVRDAIRRYERDGKDAVLAYYSDPERFDGQWYVFILDSEGYTIASPYNFTIGFGPSDRYDATGYYYGDDLVSATEEGKWISYVFFNPETDKEERKHTWIVRHDGLYFGSGFYKGQEQR